MTPDLDKAARAAADASDGSFRPDPLRLLQSMPNVLLIAFESSAGVLNGQNSMALVEKRNGNLHYIVLYNSSLPHYQLQRALARELGHVLLRHDGASSEYIWSEEADCFAFHFLCARPAVPVLYRPLYSSLSMSFKDMRKFPSLDALRQAIADERTRYSYYVGKNISYTPDDVQISALDDDLIAGWKNYSSVSVAGCPVGFCGE